ncbi:hypothetical protein ACMD2_23791, partial [Ananas comosus]
MVSLERNLVAVECLLKVVTKVSLRGDGGYRDINIFVQRSLVRLCGLLESVTSFCSPDFFFQPLFYFLLLCCFPFCLRRGDDEANGLGSVAVASGQSLQSA